MATSAFAGYPAPFVYAEPDGKKKVQQLIWGDWVGLGRERRSGWVKVAKARNASGWMRQSDLQKDRVLEVNFVDVGQGDGCFVVTPDDRFLVVDAGKEDNLFWFLRWRFNLSRNPWRVVHVDDAVITHPDADHYEGFRALFESPNFTFGHVHHNGLVERKKGGRLGPVHQAGKVKYHDVTRSRSALTTLLRSPDTEGPRYPALLRTALRSGRVGDVRMASSLDGHLPGYGPDDPGDLTIEVLGPVPERVDRKLRLRRLGSDGETKNGHSVVLRLRLGDVSVLLTGDINVRAQDHLLRHYTGADPKKASEREAMVETASTFFRAEVAKSCHHGSADAADYFLRAVDAIATVVSSGDDEPYSHPRPDSLGLLGKHGRGERPLVFSTELARSTREFTERPEAVRARSGREIEAARAEANAGAEEPPTAQRYARAVAVYGMVNLRTDGTRVMMAQKLERPAPGGVEWDVHRMEPGPDGLAYVSRH